jgi:nicotinate-nucleotide--dimethylbenzimidazole phosphoribosyltransferase
MNIAKLAGKIKPVGGERVREARKHLDRLTKPPGSLGRIEEMAAKLVALYGGTAPDSLDKKAFVFAGDHGVAAEGVSAYPAEVTRQMVLNFLHGGAAVNVLARHAAAGVIVIDIGVKSDFPDIEGLVREKIVHGTANMTEGPAMTREEALKTIEVGIKVAREHLPAGYGLFAAGEMGIGNTTPSAAIASVITGTPVAEVTGRGTGIDDEKLAKKIRVIEKAIAVNSPDPRDPLDVLSKIGGAEIGGIAGLCLGAASGCTPVIVDGFISTAGALLACCLDPKTADYLFASHRSRERGHAAMLAHMGLKPILDLDLRLGEGTGAVLTMHIVEAGLKIYREMATFQEAGVREKLP